MAAQVPPFVLLHPTTTTSASNSAQTAATVSTTSNASYYQARTGQNSGYLGPPASYISYGANNGSSAATTSYYRAPNPSVYQGTGYVNGPAAQSTSTNPSTITGTSAAPNDNSKPAVFRAPAHKHAHHLHSIPPREKSTRTLIIDHMLWVHGRTRFAQARAELGMTDRTGGSSSSNYAHRTRPENYEEEDEVGSEGEETTVLKARGAVNDRSEETRLSKQDLSLARTLRLRAEGLEKVVTSMLDQPPPVPHQPPADDYNYHHHYHHHHHHSHSHWQKYETSPNTRTGKHPHTLPNGVRLRLALGTIINDLFARQAPHPPFRHTHPPGQDHQHQQDSDALPPPTISVTPSPDNLPEALLPLTRISGVFAPKVDSQHQRSPSAQSYGSNSSPYQTLIGSSPSPLNQYQTSPKFHQQVTTGPSPFIVPGSQIYTVQPLQQTPRPRGPPVRPTPPQRAIALYASGAAPSHASSPASRCPRHLQTGCEICVEAKSLSSRPGPSGSSSSSRAFIVPSSSSSSSKPGFSSLGGQQQAGAGGPASGITGWQDGSGMGAGLLKLGLRGSVLRRKVYLGTEEHQQHSNSAGSTPSSSGTSDMDDRVTGAGNTKLSRLIPRFIKLSALVAGELGREARGEEVEDSSSSGSEYDYGSDDGTERGGGQQQEAQQSQQHGQQQQSQLGVGSGVGSLDQGLSHQGPQGEIGQGPSAQGPPGSPGSIRRRQQLQQQHEKMYDYALRPTREWYMLLAGLLTRAVLEGYLTAGWSGVEAAECLLLLGLGLDNQSLTEDDDESEDSSDDEEREVGDEEEVEVEETLEQKEARRKKAKAKKWRKRRKRLEMFDEDEEFSEFHPDEYPSLLEAIRVLFPSLRKSTSGVDRRSRKGKGRAEAEYEAEMYERLRRFYDIPASTPDLATHMEDLVWQYPAEPVERAAVRFCEAVAKWRGKPELETYKKKPPNKSTTTSGTGASTATDPLHQLFGTGEVLSIDSLVHSNPTSPVLAHMSGGAGMGNMAGAVGQYANRKVLKKPVIDVYFAARESSGSGEGSSAWKGSPTAAKRRRPEEDGDGRDGMGVKRMHT